MKALTSVSLALPVRSGILLSLITPKSRPLKGTALVILNYILYTCKVIHALQAEITTFINKDIQGIISFRSPSLLQPCRALAITLRLFMSLFMKFVKTVIKNPIYLPLKTIRESIQFGWEGSLAYYCLLRRLHKRPIIYKYSLRSLGAQINCSTTCLANHLRILQQEGLIEVIDGSIHFKTSNELRDETKSMLIPVHRAKVKNHQVTFFRLAVAKRNLAAQHSLSTKKTKILQLEDPKKRFSVKEIKTLTKLRDNFYPHLTERSVCNDAILSNAKFGELSNRSKSTGVRIQKELNKYNLIKSTKNIEKCSDMKHNRRSFFELELNSSYFLSKEGFIFRRLPNIITPSRVQRSTLSK